MTNAGASKDGLSNSEKSTGFYELVEFKAEPQVIEKLEVAFRRDERVLRYLTVKLEKYAAQYAENVVTSNQKGGLSNGTSTV